MRERHESKRILAINKNQYTRPKWPTLRRRWWASRFARALPGCSNCRSHTLRVSACCRSVLLANCTQENIAADPSDWRRDQRHPHHRHERSSTSSKAVDADRSERIKNFFKLWRAGGSMELWPCSRLWRPRVALWWGGAASRPNLEDCM